MQIETIVRYQFIPSRMALSKKTNSKNVGEDIEKQESSYIACGEGKWYGLFGK